MALVKSTQQLYKAPKIEVFPSNFKEAEKSLVQAAASPLVSSLMVGGELPTAISSIINLSIEKHMNMFARYTGYTKAATGSDRKDILKDVKQVFCEQKWIKVAQISIILEMGCKGEFGETKVFTRNVVVDWCRQFRLKKGGPVIRYRKFLDDQKQAEKSAKEKKEIQEYFSTQKENLAAAVFEAFLEKGEGLAVSDIPEIDRGNLIYYFLSKKADLSIDACVQHKFDNRKGLAKKMDHAQFKALASSSCKSFVMRKYLVDQIKSGGLIKEILEIE